MPQLSQIGEIYASQLFWLAIVFALIYFGIGKAMVPRIQRTIENRSAMIEQDIAVAETARDAARHAQSAYEAGLETSRAEALRLTREAKAQAAEETEVRLKAGAEADTARVAEAAARVDARAAQALREIDGATVEAVEAIVAKLSGVKVDRVLVERRVKVELGHG